MIIKLVLFQYSKIFQSVFYVYLYLGDFMNKNIKILVGSVVTLYIVTIILELTGVNLF